MVLQIYHVSRQMLPTLVILPLNFKLKNFHCNFSADLLIQSAGNLVVLLTL